MICAPTLDAQPVTETRTLEKSFALIGEMRLEVLNKYGKVHLSRSPDDSVHIRVEMKASAKNPSRLRKLTDGVSFNLSSTNYFIIAETNFNRGPVDFLESLRIITNNLISTESKIEIDYYVRIPGSIKVKIDNRYGDIYLESLENDLNIYHSNGSLKSEELTGDNYFDLNFSDATFKSLKKSQIDINYSDLRIDYAEDLIIASVSTKLNAGTIVSLDTDSKRDKYSIDKISKFDAVSYFSSFNIDELYNSMQCNTRYGNVDINNMDRDFSLLSLETSFTDVKLVTPPGSSFSTDLKLDDCPAVIPSEWELEETVLDADNNKYIYQGIIGDKTTRSRVILNLTKGTLSLY
jgi:hypothetical protein